MSTDNNTSPPKKTLTLKFGDKAAVPGQLQEKLQKIKETYFSNPSLEKGTSSKKTPKPQPLNKAEDKHIKKGNTNKTLAQEKKEKAALHIKQQSEEQQQARKLRFDKMKQALTWLQETYPLCFNSYEPKPLKLHIEKDIFSQLPEELPFSRLYLRHALSYYTRHPQYLDTLSKSSHRYNLQGEAIEEITPEHQQFSCDKLNQYNARKEEIKKEKKEKRKRWLERKSKPEKETNKSL